jgi:hypothetical protein
MAMRCDLKKARPERPSRHPGTAIAMHGEKARGVGRIGTYQQMHVMYPLYNPCCMRPSIGSTCSFVLPACLNPNANSFIQFIWHTDLML